MKNLQFYTDIKNNEVVKQEGHFFKVAPFEITIGSATYPVTFERKDEGKVYHIVFRDNQEWLLLEHPDYVPKCLFEDLNSFTNNADAQTIFYALCKLGLSIEKDYLKWIDSNENQTFSYSVSQQTFL